MSENASESPSAASADGKKPPGNVTVLDVGQLGMQELGQLQEQVDNELEFFVESLQQLKEVQGKFANSGECLSVLSPENQGKETLVPLTSSMYVPGTLSNVETVIIDIGTGYYAQMTVAKAKDYFLRKTQDMAKQIERVQGIVQEKQKVKALMAEALQAKVQQFVAQQQKAKQAAPVAS